MVAIDGRHSAAGLNKSQPSFAVARLLMWLMLLPAVIDYKPKGSQDWSTILYAFIFVISTGASLALMARYPIRVNRGALFAGFIALAFAVVTFVSGFVRGQEIIALVRALPPIILFSVGMFSAAALSNSPFPVEKIFDEIIGAAILGLLVNLILVASINGIDLDTIRYQVLTGGAPIVCANLIALMLFGGWRPWSTFGSFLYAGLVMISVTRTQVVVAAALVLFAFIINTPKIIRSRTLPVQIVAAFALVGALLIADAVLPSSPLERWTQRLFSAQGHHGYDITAVTRAGETAYQIAQLKDSVSGLMFGFGASAQNYFDGANARIVALILGTKAAYWTETGVGHNNYVGTIYIGGIIFGGALLVLQIVSLVNSAKVMRALNGSHFDARRTSTIAAMSLGVLAFMTFGFLGGTMGSRSACLMFGLAIGFSFWMVRKLRMSS